MGKNHLPWPERYRPKSLRELVGNQEQIQGLFEWLESWKRGIPRFRSALLLGPPGVGKTASVGAMVKDLHGELVEFNASDNRNKGQIETLVWRAASQQTLDGSIRVILLDEVDGLSGTSDRGGAGAILKIIESTVHPVIMTANDPESPRLKDLLKRCRIFQFDPISHQDILTVLKRIIEKQSLSIAEGVLDDIIDNSNGDLRAAISDLELVVTTGLSDADISNRDIHRSMEELLKRLFMVTDMETAKHLLSDIDADYDQLILWLEENVPLHLLNPQELERGYETLSQADLFLGRIWRGPNWRLLAYFYDILACGIPSSRTSTPYRQVKYSQSKWPLLVWRGNMSRQKQSDLVSRLAREAGVSKARVPRTHQDAIQQIVDRSPSRESAFTDWLLLKKGTFGRSKGPRPG